MKVSSTGQAVELEGGEGVINKRSMADPDLHTFNGKKMSNCQIVSAINEQHGGRKMNCDDAAVGGASRMEHGGDVDYRGSHTAPGPDDGFDDNTLDNQQGCMVVTSTAQWPHDTLVMVTKKMIRQ